MATAPVPTSALVVTVGGSKSTSFATVSEADSYISAANLDTDSTTRWTTTLSIAEKDFRLRLAAQFMGTLPLRGGLVYEYQALCFPRTCQNDVTIIPSEIKEAQSLIACMVIDKNIAHQTDESGTGPTLEDAMVKSVDVMGVMKVNLSYDVNTTAKNVTNNWFRKVLSTYGAPIWIILKPYVTQVRGGTFADYAATSFTLLTSPDYTE